MPFKFNEDVAIADIAVEVWANTIEDLFKDSALAVSEVMVDTKTVEPRIEREIILNSDSIEMLLFDFLSEVVYFKDAERLLFSKFEVEIVDSNLRGKFWGEEIDREKHVLRIDVKAVTLYRFNVRNESGIWRAEFVLDI
ncbi:SHS2 domain-containing protein [Candidatus Kryptonium thompsonii]|uniref:SHS2 domain-containing protein n=2 Tax=Candidatus Kryptonium thompsonii TaxID=1633631 RepID=A0A0P1LD56_9BACT|nr:archease [Candidatus Kryptonium thompsoni]CUS79173.1 SHS2 domain-containing protein [Candidatus Kryptonium thompsoni]CUS80795.1 SHS2 domain-containing protein [Candidatus Kryptonium thompsoni]CUS87798.1 SHS2 domain-containing protein [Candidatus Kryptonium thompsoni]CUS89000.1 SHS2 domain-containing protein [Candidatus Kryptonium thompsoni]CUS92315.1 SHS2 domain-containing protein [Candidatus Kryptonium thompsoni]